MAKVKSSKESHTIRLKARQNEDNTSTSITRVAIRMYCMGTGDCFILKFYSGVLHKFTMMVDCGSCSGGREEFMPYLENLKMWVQSEGIDLLIVTHEHNDHVNGFAKCDDIFKELVIRQAWFAWTENPEDPDGKAQDLLNKRERMRIGFRKAVDRMKSNSMALERELTMDFYNKGALSATKAFLTGLNTLAEINLNPKEVEGRPLIGMMKIREKLANDKVQIKYPNPGSSISLPQLPGVKFHILGPPLDKKYIYKNGKEGRDVFKKHFTFGESFLAVNSFTQLGKQPSEKDLPFAKEYILNEPSLSSDFISKAPEHMRAYLTACSEIVDKYKNEKWRNIENEWLYSAGSLAIRLNSHINNTSLALAIEIGKDGKVILLPGDAEFGSWESWHMIERWNSEVKGGKHFVEDLLNRTVFYKVAHHLSYNGTALEKGINMMNNTELAAMATLDRNRIAEKWKSTMPNKELLSELIRKCQGKCFIMDETEIQSAPSMELDFSSLGKNIYNEGSDANGKLMYKEYTVTI